MTNNPPHVIMTTNEENFLRLRVGAEQEANFQSRPAFKYALPQLTDGNSAVEMRLAEAVGQDLQRLFHTSHVRVA